jgi:DNA-directed RNA polymerase specialized sigma24 family protein
LFAVEGYSHREIAEQLEINEGTSKWHVNNARKILKEQLHEYVANTTPQKKTISKLNIV